MRLVEGIPADVCEHGAAYDEGSHDECGENAGPESHAAERNKEDVLFAGEVDTRLIGQEGLDSHCNQKTCGPDEGDSERELKGNVHHRIECSSLPGPQTEIAPGGIPFAVEPLLDPAAAGLRS